MQALHVIDGGVAAEQHVQHKRQVATLLLCAELGHAWAPP
jgi:hypothetical protein